jgi:hypothetical protein
LTKAVENIIDLTEDDLILSLYAVASSHLKRNDLDAMQVDSSRPKPQTQTPPLRDFLAHCVRAPTSSTSLSKAIYKYMKEAEVVLLVLGVLVDWVEDVGLDVSQLRQRATMKRKNFLLY